MMMLSTIPLTPSTVNMQACRSCQQTASKHCMQTEKPTREEIAQDPRLERVIGAILSGAGVASGPRPRPLPCLFLPPTPSCCLLMTMTCRVMPDSKHCECCAVLCCAVLCSAVPCHAASMPRTCYCCLVQKTTRRAIWQCLHDCLQ